MPSHIVTAWKGWYSENQVRYYGHNGGLGHLWAPASGFVQGCALSCVAQNLLMSTLIKALKEDATKHSQVEFRQTPHADGTKWQFRADPQNPNELVAAVTSALNIASEWANLPRQLFNAKS